MAQYVSFFKIKKTKTQCSLTHQQFLYLCCCQTIVFNVYDILKEVKALY